VCEQFWHGTRLLALLVGSALVDDSSVDVPDPDGAIVEALIGESRHWIGALGTMSENSVTVELFATSERWRLGQRLPEGIDRTAVYDVALEVWRLAPATTCTPTTPATRPWPPQPT
jgi:hypothetical protein